jgi:hypothetical protein
MSQRFRLDLNLGVPILSIRLMPIPLDIDNELLVNVLADLRLTLPWFQLWSRRLLPFTSIYDGHIFLLNNVRLWKSLIKGSMLVHDDRLGVTDTTFKRF